MGTILDVENVVPAITRSKSVRPGVERKLLKPRDFERFQGKKAKVTLRAPVENQRHWEGTLAGFADGVISLDAARPADPLPVRTGGKGELEVRVVNPSSPSG